MQNLNDKQSYTCACLHEHHELVNKYFWTATWTIVLIERLFELSGKKNLTDIWPNLELYVHGGVSFTPYRERFKQLIKSAQVNYLETYNASEGFLGIQDRLEFNDMLLMARLWYLL